MLLKKTLVFVAGLFAVSIAGDAVHYSKSVTISYEVLGTVASKANPLATVLYDPASLKYTLSSWTPPSLDALKSTSTEPSSTPLVRILLPDGSTSITSLGAFDNNLSQHLNLWISSDTEGAAFAASVSSLTPPPLSKEEEEQRKKEERLRARGKTVPKPKPKPKSKSKDPKVTEEAVKEFGPVVKVNLIRSSRGPVPHLNTRKPPQVDADGREVVQEEQPEKSFFQKYWYIILIASVFLIGGGGGGGDK